MSIYVSPLHLVRQEAQRFQPHGIISIVDPRTENPVFDPNVKVLNLKFHDVCFEPRSIYDKERYVHPTREIVEEIFNFGAVSMKKGERLLTHCFAGVSRSSAAAIIALSPQYGWQEAVRMVAEVKVNHTAPEPHTELGSRWFMPNNLMIDYADDFLCLNGELRKLVATTFSY